MQSRAEHTSTSSAAQYPTVQRTEPNPRVRIDQPRGIGRSMAWTTAAVVTLTTVWVAIALAIEHVDPIGGSSTGRILAAFLLIPPAMLAWKTLDAAERGRAAGATISLLPVAAAVILARLTVANEPTFDVIDEPLSAALAVAIAIWIARTIPDRRILLSLLVVASIADVISVLSGSGYTRSLQSASPSLFTDVIELTMPSINEPAAREAGRTLGLVDVFIAAWALDIARTARLPLVRFVTYIVVAILATTLIGDATGHLIPAIPFIAIAAIWAFHEPSRAARRVHAIAARLRTSNSTRSDQAASAELPPEFPGLAFEPSNPIRTWLRRSGAHGWLVARLGLRWWLLPRWLRATMVTRSLPRSRARSILATIRSMDDWTERWCNAGDEERRAGRLGSAAGCYGWARAGVERGSPRWLELRAQRRATYLERDDLGEWFVPVGTWGDVQWPALVRLPGSWDDTAPGSRDLLVIVAGFDEAKEQFHRLANAALASGLAVCFIDVPGPDGALDHFDRYVPDVVRSVAAQIGSTPAQAHLFGNCFGSSMVMDASRYLDPASVATVSASADLEAFARRYPWASRTLLDLDVERDGSAERLPARIRLTRSLHECTAPALIIHGALDPIVSAVDSLTIQRSWGGEVDLLIRPLDGHGCARSTALITERVIAHALAARSHRTTP